MEKEVLTTYDISKCCHVHIATVTNWIKDDSLKAYKTKGGHRRVKKTDLLDFLQKYNMPINLKQKILIIDDDKAILEGLKEAFESNGYEVNIATNGLAGALLVEKHRPAVVILDLIMPLFDGFYFCELIKKQPYSKYIKIVVLTGYMSKENIEKAKRVGVAKIIAKPVSNVELVREVKKVL